MPVDALIDAPLDAPQPVVAHHHYVMNTLLVPMNNTQALDYGMDLNGDQVVDNQLGMVMATLSGMGFEIQNATNASVDRGEIIELFDLGTDNFTTAAFASFNGFAGATPVPAPCNSAGDVVCRHHLTGAGTFTIASTSPMNAALTGTIANGTLTTTAGHLLAPITLGFGGPPVYVTLIGARVQLSQASDPSITTMKLTGGITQSDIDTKVIPPMRDGIEAQVIKDCTALASPPQCGCASGSTGATYISLFDANQNCSVSLTEVKNNSLIASLSRPTSCSRASACRMACARPPCRAASSRPIASDPRRSEGQPCPVAALRAGADAAFLSGMCRPMWVLVAALLPACVVGSPGNSMMTPSSDDEPEGGLPTPARNRARVARAMRRLWLRRPALLRPADAVLAWRRHLHRRESARRIVLRHGRRHLDHRERRRGGGRRTLSRDCRELGRGIVLAARARGAGHHELRDLADPECRHQLRRLRPAVVRTVRSPDVRRARSRSPRSVRSASASRVRSPPRSPRPPEPSR